MLRRWATMEFVNDSTSTPRHQQWAATMGGFAGEDGIIRAHADSFVRVQPREWRRADRENGGVVNLTPGATREFGAGRREREEEPDEYRTCFERDRDRILHSSAFRRLSGKTQVFVFPEDHMRTRLTHALEVAQVATSVARATGLNVTLTEAIALGHDCGHGPGGHASEDALEIYLPDGFDHASFGADVALAPLNLCAETLDGVRQHSWSRPAPSTPEGEVVSWADRIAYVCHDFEDALGAGVVRSDDLPRVVRERCGDSRAGQLRYFIRALIATISSTGVVGMAPEPATTLAEFRDFNYRTIYMRDASTLQARRVVDMLRALVEYYEHHPQRLPSDHVDSPGGTLAAAVGYVAGMTDGFACRAAVELLDWPLDQLPNGIDR